MKKVHENAVWVPIVHEGVVMVANKKLKNLKAHNIYVVDALQGARRRTMKRRALGTGGT